MKPDPRHMHQRLHRRVVVSAGLAFVAALLTTAAAPAPKVAAAPAPKVVAAPAPNAAAAPAPKVVAGPPLQSSTGFTYELVDTWSNVPWQLTAGRFAEVTDISSAPDGTIYVLDRSQVAVHVLEPDGTPRRVFLVPTTGGRGDWTPSRLDVGMDGAVYVLSDGQRAQNGGKYPARVDTLTPSGGLRSRFEVETARPRVIVDVAVRADGRVYLSRAGEGNPYIIWPGPTATPTPGTGEIPGNAVDVFRPDGTYLESISPPEMAIPGNLDVAADGTLYVINRVPSPWGEPPDGPDPTPRPSLGAGGPPAADMAAPNQGASPTATAAPGSNPIEGVLIFDPDHRYLETERFSGAEDVAVGPAGVFVSRNVEIFALRESLPLYVGPAGRVVNAFFGRIVYNLDVPADGRLLSSMSHCYFQGLLVFDDPTARPASARYLGASDAPLLEGPPYPLRVSASEEVAVLQGRFEASGDPGDRFYMATNYLFEAQSVQRWTRYGEVRAESPLRSQLGVCAGSQSWWTRDVAIDGTDVYTVDSNLLQMRPDDKLPSWTLAPVIVDEPEALSMLVAVSADAGRVAVLDAGSASVYVADRDGRLVTSWPVADGQTNALPIDIAVSGDVAYLADLGRGRVAARSMDNGDPIEDWSTHDGPRAIAVGPDGDVFLLGRGGWGFRYAPDGTMRAAWPMPDRSFDALDIAVDVDGRVYVSYVDSIDLAEPEYGREIVAFEIGAAGVWVFEPAPAAPVEPPSTDACLARPDKWASPDRVRLGETVDVTLAVDGRCPGAYEPVQVVLVLDTSRSMNFADAIGRARTALSQLLARLDPLAAEVGLVTFDEGAALKAQLSRDIAAAGALALAEGADGDTLLAPGIELARQELTGPRGDPSARRIVLIVTDGVFYDEPLAAAEDARADGLEVWAMVLPSHEFNQINRETVDEVAGSPDNVFVDPDPSRLASLADELTRYRDNAGLFESVTVHDVVPENMRYIVGSAAPVATWDAQTRTLSWRFGRVMATSPIELHYRLEPLEAGTWPTNVEATAPYRDVLGNDGRLVFPIPEVEVYTLSQSVYLPFLSKHSCYRTDKPLDIVLVMDSSSSMLEDAAGGGTKLDAAKAAATTFSDQLKWSIDQAAVVAFDTTARREIGLSGDPIAVRAAIGSIVSTPGTHIDLGLAEARRVLGDGGREAAKPVVILLTDGYNNAGPDPVLLQADGLQRAGVTVYTIGLGENVDETLLRAVATSPDHAFASPTADDLAEIYRRISEKISCE